MQELVQMRSLNSFSANFFQVTPIAIDLATGEKLLMSV